MSQEQVRHLRLKDVNRFILSTRSVKSYQDTFGVDFSSFDQIKPGELICDVGSGLRQELAKGLRGVPVFYESKNGPIIGPIYVLFPLTPVSVYLCSIRT